MAIKIKIIILFLFIASFVESVDKEALKNCGQMPKACTFTLGKPAIFTTEWKYYSILCEVNELNKGDIFIKPNNISKCPLYNQPNLLIHLISKNDFVKWFYSQGLLDFAQPFSYQTKYIYFENINGFYVNFMDQHYNKEKDITQYYKIYEIRIRKSKINFYDQNAKLMSSCADFYRSNQTSPATFFQIKDIDNMWISLDNGEYKTSLCPLLFKNSNIDTLVAFSMMNTFYKKNVLKFSDDFDEKREDLNSHIYAFQIEYAHNIDLDSSLLNKHVFAKTTDNSNLKSIKFNSNRFIQVV